MLKFIKRIFQFLLVLILLVSVATIVIVNFVNPNQFKSIIESETLKHTGHVLKIQGSLNWRWYPILALELQEVELENAAPLTHPLLSVKTASVDCAVASIISGRVLLNLKLKGLTLALERDAKGNGNWVELQNRLASPKNQSNQNATASATPVLLNSIKLEDGTVSFQDGVKKESYQIRHLSLNANNLFKGVLGSKIPVALNFDFTAPNKPTLSFAFATNWALKQNPQTLNISDIVLQCKTPEGKTIALKGEADIKELDKNPLVTGKLDSQALDLNAWLQIFEITDLPPLPSIVSLNSSFKFQNDLLEVNTLSILLSNKGTIESHFTLNVDQLSPKTLKLSGNIAAKQLQINTLKIDDVTSDFKAAEGIISLAPIQLQMANIQQKASLKIDLKGTSPKFTISQEASNFDINALLELFGVKNKVTGKTSTKINLTATGSTPNEWRKSLNGDLNLAIKEGKLQGVDLLKLLKSAQTNVYNLLSSINNKQAPNTDATLNSEVEKWNTSDSGNSTPFDSATATATISNGLLKNPDLLIVHTDFIVNGSGTLNLINEAVQYQASVMLKNNPYPASDQIASYLFQTPLPITIQGSIHDPIIRPDLKSYFNAAFKVTQKQVINNVVEKTVEKTLNKALGNLLKINQE